MKKYKTKARKQKREVIKLQAIILIVASLTAGACIMGNSVIAEPVFAEINFKAQRHLPENENKPVVVELITNNPTVEMQIREIAREYNFKWEDYLIKLANCESRLNPKALGDNGNSRGLFQIHKGYHPTVTDEQAYNIRWATIWTMNKINAGYQGLWSCDRIIKNKI